MTVLTFILALAALGTGIFAVSRSRQALERADDNLRYLTDLKNRVGLDTKDLFRELYHIKVRQLKAAGKLDYAPYEITDACIACGACEPECPEEAIRPGDAYRIIPDKCSACGSCADICPVEACVEMEIN